jgi:hypothetical protein
VALVADPIAQSARIDGRQAKLLASRTPVEQQVQTCLMHVKGAVG